MVKEDLQKLKIWADGKIAAGKEPAWAWYQFMKLREALDAIIAQMEMESVALEMESSLLTSPYAERGPRLVISNTRCEHPQKGSKRMSFNGPGVEQVGALIAP